MKFQNHLTGGIVTATASTIYLNSNTEWILSKMNQLLNFFFIQNITISISTFFLLIVSILSFSILNDLDNCKSKVGKIFFFISIPANIISYLIIRFFYKRSFEGRDRSIKNNDSGFFSSRFTVFLVSHRMLFHSDLGLGIFLYVAYLLQQIYSFNSIVYFGITIGYLTHLLLDWIHGKIPMPVIIRVLFFIISILTFGKIKIKKEMLGLNLRIG